MVRERKKTPHPLERRAEEVKRSLRALERLEGIPLLEAGRLYLLVMPADGPVTSLELTRVLASRELPERHRLAKLLGAAEVIELDRGRIGTWARHLARLSSRRDLDSLRAEGVRSLRRYRGRDLSAELENRAGRLEHFGRLVAAAEGESPGDRWFLRLWALGSEDGSVEEEGAPFEPVPGKGRAAGRGGEGSAAEEALAVVLRAGRLRSGTASRADTAAPVSPRFEALHRKISRRGSVHAVLEARAAAEGLSLPEVDALPAERRAQWLDLAERSALVYGIGAAIEVLRHLLLPYRAMASEEQRRRDHLRAFVELCRHPGTLPPAGLVARGTPRGLPKRLAKVLEQVPPRGPRLPRAMAGAFADWVDCLEIEPLLSRRQLARRIRGLDSPLAIARRLSHIWSEAARNADRERPSAVPGFGSQICRATLSLLHPDLAPRLPNKVRRPAELVALVARLEGPEQAARVRLAIDLAEKGRLDDATRPLVESLPPAFVERALGLGVLDGVVYLCDEGWEERGKVTAAAARYLDCVELLDSGTSSQPWVCQDWFVNLFRHPRHWQAAVCLASVARSRVDGPANWGLEALAKATRSKNDPLADALETWRRAEVEDPPPELERLVALGLDRESLEHYLHHKRLAGEGERFSDAIAAPLHTTERLDRQIEYLRARLAEAESMAEEEGAEQGPAEPAASLRSSLQAIERRRASERAARKLVRRASRTLERSLESLRRRSLEVMLDRASRGSAEALLGRPLPQHLPEGFLQAFHLLHSESVDFALVRELVIDVLADRPLAHRPPNRQWIARAQERGIDVERWVEGLRFEAEVDGEVLRFETEDDPLHVLRMGSYFDTCLALEHGFNAASTLTNALDINKHVIYAYGGEGRVVGRKLVAATADGKLAGYYTYASESGPEIHAILCRELARFAEQCGLVLDDRATPENLHGGFWYDDGNEPWQGATKVADLEEVPEGLPTDRETRYRWHMEQAINGRELGRIRFLLPRLESTGLRWKGILLLHEAEGSRAWPKLVATGFEPGNATWLVRTMASRRGPEALTGLYSLWSDEASGAADVIRGALSAFGPDPARNERLLAAASSVRDRAEDMAGERELHISSYMTRLSPASFVRTLRWVGRIHGMAFGGSAPAADPAPSWVERMLSRYILVAYLSAEPRSGFCRHLAKNEDLVPLIARAGRFVPMPELRSTFRKRYIAQRDAILRRPSRRAKRAFELDGEIQNLALALGAVGGRSDATALLELLRSQPTDLAVAAAVVRCGDSEQAALARRLWQPPAGIENRTGEEEIAHLLRTVASPTFASRLRRQVRRCLAAGEPFGEELAAVALMGFEELSPIAVVEALDPDLVDHEETRDSQEVWEITHSDADSDLPAEIWLSRLAGKDEAQRRAALDELCGDDRTAWALPAALVIGDRVEGLCVEGIEELVRRLCSIEGLLSLEEAQAAASLAEHLEPEVAASAMAHAFGKDYLGDAWTPGIIWFVHWLESSEIRWDFFEDPLVDLFEERQGKLLRAFEGLLVWADPERIQPVIGRVLARLPPFILAWEWAEVGDDEAGHHLDLLMLEHVVPRLSPDALGKLAEKVDSEWYQPRHHWVEARILEVRNRLEASRPIEDQRPAD